MGGGSCFRVLEDLESDDCASRAAARPRKRVLRQVSATTDKHVSCCRRQDDCASGAAARPRKRVLRQVSATTDKHVSCCRRQDDDASVTWSGERGPSAIRSDVQGRAMTSSIGISLVSGQPGNCKRNFQFF